MATTSFDKQNLPVYSNPDLEETSPTSLPPSNATPATVREFIGELLVHRRGLSLDHAHRIAAHWTVGSGREVSSYSPTIYIKIFGHEDGWVLYKEIRILLWKQRQRGRGRSKGSLYVIIIALVVWSAAMFHLFVSSNRAANGGAMATTAFGLVGGMAGIYFVASQIYLDANFDPEAQAEDELRCATRRV